MVVSFYLCILHYVCAQNEYKDEALSFMSSHARVFLRNYVRACVLCVYRARVTNGACNVVGKENL